jgi:hypothetical protein
MHSSVNTASTGILTLPVWKSDFTTGRTPENTTLKAALQLTTVSTSTRYVVALTKHATPGVVECPVFVVNLLSIYLTGTRTAPSGEVSGLKVPGIGVRGLGLRVQS